MSSTRTPQWNLVRLMLYSALVATVYGSCTKPPDLTYAVPSVDSKESYEEMETVTYTCLVGFIAVPSLNNVATCLSNGWSPFPEPFCHRICPMPENLTYAVPNIDKTTYEEGDKVIYSCLPEYKYIPSINNVSTCDVNGAWSSFPEDFCAKLQCDIPDLLKNGNIEFLDTVLGSVASYKCLEGYIMFGNDKRYCLANEKWNGTVPSCNRTCPEPPNLQSTIINTPPSQAEHYYPRSTQINYTCISGFTPNTSLTSSTTCQSDFTWTQITEFCMRVSCGSPGNLENGGVDMKDDKFQSIAKFVCNEGYMLVGNRNRECLEDRSWSGSIPTCHRSCPEPPKLNSSEIVWMPDIGYFPERINVIYKCLPGYKYDPFQLPIIQCLEGFTWSSITEFCKKVICGEPERTKNGNVEKTGTDFESVATYSCNPGFNMTGSPQRRCTEDSVWEGCPPVCQ